VECSAEVIPNKIATEGDERRKLGGKHTTYDSGYNTKAPAMISSSVLTFWLDVVTHPHVESVTGEQDCPFASSRGTN